MTEYVKTLRMTSRGTVIEKAKVIDRLTVPEGARYGRLTVEFADGVKQTISTHPDFTITIKQEDIMPENNTTDPGPVDIETTAEYPHPSGEFIVIGPECFIDPKANVICYKGENYVQQVDAEERVEVMAKMLASWNRVIGDEDENWNVEFTEEMRENTREFVRDMLRAANVPVAVPASIEDFMKIINERPGYAADILRMLNGRKGDES